MKTISSWEFHTFMKFLSFLHIKWGQDLYCSSNFTTQCLNFHSFGYKLVKLNSRNWSWISKNDNITKDVEQEENI